jgi:2-keto-4-pentenoate hydratase/2-oxohepta-3-ene-1,7-dioic acid hydratase in catechol pathway
MKTRPSKIVCVGRSYADHVKELNNAMPDVRCYLSNHQVV